jgi:hypothetical protein
MKIRFSKSVEKMIPYTSIPNTNLIMAARRLPPFGKLAMRDDLLYLDIDNHFILNLLPLTNIRAIKPPDYFGEQGIGAHISVIYPDELITVPILDFEERHSFVISGFFKVIITPKQYFALGVISPALDKIRAHCHLPAELCFKGYQVGFHITLGHLDYGT